MIAIKQIEEFGRQIGRQFHPQRVILFGSYIQGSANEDSDVDLLVIGSFQGRNVDQSVKIRMKLRPKFPVDLLVRTPEKVQQRLEMGDSFIQKILQEGRVLYEADN
ncbi:MAG: nucleotidyltransferase domain-containing protein [Planctomycetes bacterium]|nr:nucleotidyltransferase domain-containing protein [Planctomycetota bacterium]MCK5472615.1 nucleotidyltransferase domain-containing protein [Planctomycetota bacterium]